MEFFLVVKFRVWITLPSKKISGVFASSSSSQSLTTNNRAGGVVGQRGRNGRHGEESEVSLNI